MTPWEWINRATTVLAALASLAAVILAYWSIRLMYHEQARLRQREAAVTLNVADLLRRRADGMWRSEFGMASVWPDGSQFDHWLKEIEQDVSFAGTLQDRAAQIDLQTVTHAEIVWRSYFHIRSLLFLAKVSWHNNVSGRANISRVVQESWQECRFRLLKAVEEAIAGSDELEKLFEVENRRIAGVPRDTYMSDLSNRITQTARQNTQTYLDGIDGGTAGTES